jgi:hypothetical protein
MLRTAKARQGPVAPEAISPQVSEITKEKAQEAGNALVIYGENPLELVLPDTLPEADFLAFGVNIGRAMEFASWRIGDWVNFGLVKFGYKDYEKLAGVTGLSEQYLKACSSVAGRVPPALRGVASLERARLMLSRKGETESVEHLFKRLGGKTTDQLRKLTRGGGRGGVGGEAGKAMSVQDFYNACGNLATFANKLDKDKWPVIAAYEKSEQNGGYLDGLRGELTALLAAINDLPN